MNLKIGISKLLLLLYPFILFILFILYAISLSSRQNVIFSAVVLIINLVALILFSIHREPVLNLKNQYIRIVPIFLFAYCIVFFQLHLDYVLGNFDESYTRFWVDPSIVPKALVISSIGLVSFLYGYTLRKEKNKKNMIENDYAYNYKCSILGFNMISFFFMCLMIITINPLYLLGGYGVYEMGVIARYSSILFELSITASLVQHIINLRLDNKINISIVNYIFSLGFVRIFLLLIYCSVVVISGDRGPIIFLIVAIAASYIILTKWKISILKFISVLFVTSVLISALVIIRESDKNTSLFSQVYGAVIEGHKPYKSLENSKSISNSTLELSTSIRTLHNAVKFVPSERPFFYGKLQFLQLVTVIPLSQPVFQDLFGLKEYESSSEKYVTYLIGGDGGTEGSSCVADLYLDFGMVGVLFGLFMFGYITRYLEVKAFQDNLPSRLSLVAFVLICQYSIYIPRATIMFNFRNIIWVLLIIKFVNLFSKKIIVEK